MLSNMVCEATGCFLVGLIWETLVCVMFEISAPERQHETVTLKHKTVALWYFFAVQCLAIGSLLAGLTTDPHFGELNSVACLCWIFVGYLGSFKAGCYVREL